MSEPVTVALVVTANGATRTVLARITEDVGDSTAVVTTGLLFVAKEIMTMFERGENLSEYIEGFGTWPGDYVCETEHA